MRKKNFKRLAYTCHHYSQFLRIDWLITSLKPTLVTSFASVNAHIKAPIHSGKSSADRNGTERILLFCLNFVLLELFFTFLFLHIILTNIEGVYGSPRCSQQNKKLTTK